MAVGLGQNCARNDPPARPPDELKLVFCPVLIFVALDWLLRCVKLSCTLLQTRIIWVWRSGGRYWCLVKTEAKDQKKRFAGKVLESAGSDMSLGARNIFKQLGSSVRNPKQAGRQPSLWFDIERHCSSRHRSVRNNNHSWSRVCSFTTLDSGRSDRSPSGRT